jgi:DNA-binding Lrp family transcriptional regulator
MRKLDEQEKLIARALVRDPRLSDHAVSEATGVPAKTVTRKRAKMEADGILSYYTQVNMLPTGTGHYNVRHLYIVKFKLGLSRSQLIQEMIAEPRELSVFTELIYESHIAEIDGQLALLLVIEGKDDSDIVDNVQSKLIPLMRKNHGADSIEEVRTIRILDSVRTMRNYMPFVNMKNGYIVPEWRNESIYVG